MKRYGSKRYGLGAKPDSNPLGFARVAHTDRVEARDSEAERPDPLQISKKSLQAAGIDLGNGYDLGKNGSLTRVPPVDLNEDPETSSETDSDSENSDLDDAETEEDFDEEDLRFELQSAQDLVEPPKEQTLIQRAVDSVANLPWISRAIQALILALICAVLAFAEVSPRLGRGPAAFAFVGVFSAVMLTKFFDVVSFFLPTPKKGTSARSWLQDGLDLSMFGGPQIGGLFGQDLDKDLRAQEGVDVEMFEGKQVVINKPGDKYHDRVGTLVRFDPKSGKWAVSIGLPAKASGANSAKSDEREVADFLPEEVGGGKPGKDFDADGSTRLGFRPFAQLMRLVRRSNNWALRTASEVLKYISIGVWAYGKIAMQQSMVLWLAPILGNYGAWAIFGLQYANQYAGGVETLAPRLAGFMQPLYNYIGTSIGTYQLGALYRIVRGDLQGSAKLGATFQFGTAILAGVMRAICGSANKETEDKTCERWRFLLSLPGVYTALQTFIQSKDLLYSAIGSKGWSELSVPERFGKLGCIPPEWHLQGWGTGVKRSNLGVNTVGTGLVGSLTQKAINATGVNSGALSPLAQAAVDHRRLLSSAAEKAKAAAAPTDAFGAAFRGNAHFSVKGTLKFGSVLRGSFCDESGRSVHSVAKFLPSQGGQRQEVPAKDEIAITRRASELRIGPRVLAVLRDVPCSQAYAKDGEILRIGAQGGARCDVLLLEDIEAGGEYQRADAALRRVPSNALRIAIAARVAKADEALRSNAGVSHGQLHGTAGLRKVFVSRNGDVRLIDFGRATRDAPTVTPFEFFRSMATT